MLPVLQSFGRLRISLLLLRLVVLIITSAVGSNVPGTPKVRGRCDFGSRINWNVESQRVTTRIHHTWSVGLQTQFGKAKKKHSTYEVRKRGVPNAKNENSAATTGGNHEGGITKKSEPFKANYPSNWIERSVDCSKLGTADPDTVPEYLRRYRASVLESLGPHWEPFLWGDQGIKELVHWSRSRDFWADNFPDENTRNPASTINNDGWNDTFNKGFLDDKRFTHDATSLTTAPAFDDTGIRSPYEFFQHIYLGEYNVTRFQSSKPWLVVSQLFADPWISEFTKFGHFSRWLILYRYGGFYMDTDVELWKTPEPLIRLLTIKGEMERLSEKAMETENTAQSRNGTAKGDPAQPRTGDTSSSLVTGEIGKNMILDWSTGLLYSRPRHPFGIEYFWHADSTQKFPERGITKWELHPPESYLYREKELKMKNNLGRSEAGPSIVAGTSNNTVSSVVDHARSRSISDNTVVVEPRAVRAVSSRPGNLASDERFYAAGRTESEEKQLASHPGDKHDRNSVHAGAWKFYNFEPFSVRDAHSRSIFGPHGTDEVMMLPLWHFNPISLEYDSFVYQAQTLRQAVLKDAENSIRGSNLLDYLGYNSDEKSQNEKVGATDDLRHSSDVIGDGNSQPVINLSSEKSVEQHRISATDILTHRITDLGVYMPEGMTDPTEVKRALNFFMRRLRFSVQMIEAEETDTKSRVVSKGTDIKSRFEALSINTKSRLEALFLNVRAAYFATAASIEFILFAQFHPCYGRSCESYYADENLDRSKYENDHYLNSSFYSYAYNAVNRVGPVSQERSDDQRSAQLNHFLNEILFKEEDRAALSRVVKELQIPLVGPAFINQGAGPGWYTNRTFLLDDLNYWTNLLFILNEAIFGEEKTLRPKNAVSNDRRIANGGIDSVGVKASPFSVPNSRKKMVAQFMARYYRFGPFSQYDQMRRLKYGVPGRIPTAERTSRKDKRSSAATGDDRKDEASSPSTSNNTGNIPSPSNSKSVLDSIRTGHQCRVYDDCVPYVRLDARLLHKIGGLSPERFDALLLKDRQISRTFSTHYVVRSRPNLVSREWLRKNAEKQIEEITSGRGNSTGTVIANNMKNNDHIGASIKKAGTDPDPRDYPDAYHVDWPPGSKVSELLSGLLGCHHYDASWTGRMSGLEERYLEQKRGQFVRLHDTALQRILKYKVY